jgi:hypothetical protein
MGKGGWGRGKGDLDPRRTMLPMNRWNFLGRATSPRAPRFRIGALGDRALPTRPGSSSRRSLNGTGSSMNQVHRTPSIGVRCLNSGARAVPARIPLACFQATSMRHEDAARSVAAWPQQPFPAHHSFGTGPAAMASAIAAFKGSCGGIPVVPSASALAWPRSMVGLPVSVPRTAMASAATS